MRGPWSKLRGRVFPDHWSLLFGQIAFYSFVVVVLSGVFLTVFYDPSTEQVVYDGPYAPLRGAPMSRALDSTLGITFEVPGGLLMRQVHHWGTLIMVAAILLHLLRLFFTGAFRRPRRLSWLVVFGLLLVTLAAALTGTSLADDMASGTSLAVLDGVLQATPVVGTALSALLFGGDFPGDVISRFYPLHVIVLPAVLVLLFVAGAVLALKHKPAQHAGPGRTDDNVVGRPVAVAAVKSVGLFCFVAGLELVMAATATINPVWMYGPADPANTSAGVGPAWYLAFLDGALRLAPGWEVVWWGKTMTLAVLIPVAVCTLYLVLVAVYPFIESWVTGDSSDHHLLERPRNNPTRTGIGVAGVLFYGVLWAAAGADTMAIQFGLSVNSLLRVFQVLLIAGPPVAFVLTRQICIALQGRDQEIIEHGIETGQIIRQADGGYVELHRPVDASRRRRLTRFAQVPLAQVPDSSDWRVSSVGRLRIHLSRYFDEGHLTHLTDKQVTRNAVGSPSNDVDRQTS
ncbi:ubiquinol-cytochrome c reductase cytochrome b subunit [Kribbella sp. VKM Ac-2527]|uniref:Cytochrome bc1 complex cytochrome b subunit n=1 Tax=Kribbella caucasensis TaxID=2512215 RepID=A0A4R6KRB9_9ACTN|nr:cytochrome b N-terminal domain-containing protein [Kribbella sp. VKM Ac-2527]TDO54313.1 ubiquinol-cytochrome c reductase cytochrome b subunit [Kribbella sp. VKM Ac-2527]